MFDGINYVESAFKIGLDYGIISDAEYDEYYGRRRFKESDINNFERRYAALDLEKMKNEIAEPYLLDKVFRIFMDASRSQNDGKYLSEAHVNYLLGRHLTEEQIKHFEFFTFPNRRAMKEIIEKEERGVDVQPLVAGAVLTHYAVKCEKWKKSHKRHYARPFDKKRDRCHNPEPKRKKPVFSLY